MNDSEYEVRDFSKAVKMLKFIYENDAKEKICALQFTIRVYFENLKEKLAEKASKGPDLRLIK